MFCVLEKQTIQQKAYHLHCRYHPPQELETSITGGVFFVFCYPEGFTTVVANKGLDPGSVPVAIVGLEPGTFGSLVQHFNYLATKQPLVFSWDT